MKKLLIALLSVPLLFAFSSCGQTEESSDPNSSQAEPEGENATAGENTSANDDQSGAQPHTHTPESAVNENVIDATCQKEGRYDEVIYCSECGDELSRTTKSKTVTAHKYNNNICIYCGTKNPSDGLEFTSNGNGTCFVSGLGSYKDWDVVIPDVSPYGDTVTGIASSAFYNCTGINSIQIPNTVKSIGDSAFSYCLNLQSIIISDNLTSLGSSAFAGCDSLKYNEHEGMYYLGGESNPYLIFIKPKDKTKTSYELNENTVFINNHAFSYCKNLTSLVIHDGITSIGSDAFQQCSALTSITLSENLTVISDNTFVHCGKLESISIPDKVTSIGSGAFSFCNSLKSINLGNGLTSIGDNAFYYCKNITDITLPDSVTTIGDGAFTNCSGLTNITLPDGITSIEDGTFKNCTKLEAIILPKRVTSIGYMAFDNCTALTSITIPGSVTSIGRYAFNYCTELTSVIFENTVGWRYFTLVSDTTGTSVDVTCASENAENLKQAYISYTWKRN